MVSGFIFGDAEGFQWEWVKGYVLNDGRENIRVWLHVVGADLCRSDCARLIISCLCTTQFLCARLLRVFMRAIVHSIFSIVNSKKQHL